VPWFYLQLVVAAGHVVALDDLAELLAGRHPLGVA